jgi:ABC-type polysaccharide/polyol phosphate transport system ATPase subunit
VELRNVSLRFLTYQDKSLSLKRAAIDFLLRRDPAPAPPEFWALREIDLVLRRGERVGVLGHNGAGKSTLLRLMARIYTPTTGTLALRGRVAPLIEMGAGFNPELSGRENIILSGSLLGFSKRQLEARIDSIWEFTGLQEFADLPLKYYSSGMAMRLAFAVATEVDPEILLLDEALSAGDAGFVEKAKARMLGLLDRSQLVVLVSHDMQSLREICSRGIWLEKGRLVADGPINEVIDRYLESVAAQLGAA